MIKDEISENIGFPIRNFVDKKNISEKIEKDNITVKAILDSIEIKKGIYYEKYKTNVFEWFHIYHKYKSFDISKKIIINLFFIDGNKETSCAISIDKEGVMHIIYDHNIEHKNIEQKKIVDYLVSSILPERFYSFKNGSFPGPGFNQIKISSYLATQKEDPLPIIMISLIKLIGANKTIKLLKLCDPTIISLKYSKLPNGTIIFDSILLENGSRINIKDLSSGTIEFISKAAAILLITKKSKNGGLILIDEIENKLHKELVQTLIYMLRMAFKNNNIQSIITTHNLSFLNPEISKKQILSIYKDEQNQKHIVEKVSSIVKFDENIFNKYESGLIVPYPDSNLASNTIVEIMNE